MKQTVMAVVLLVLECVGIKVVFFPYIQSVTLNNSDRQLSLDVQDIQSSNESDIGKKFKKLAEQNGALYAYKVLGHAQDKLRIREHHYAHIIGDELYKESGPDAIFYCTNEFAYGCYHSVLANAIEEKGISILPKLNQFCIEKDPNEWGCQHGIGHGVISYIGYDTEAIFDAVAICATLESEVSKRGCLGGIFMEFNQISMLDLSGESQRVLSEEGLHFPCSKVNQEYQSECYFEQVIWWLTMSDNDFERVGKLCSEVTSEKAKQWCFRRVGEFASELTKNDIKGTQKICNQMPDEGISYCLQMAQDWWIADDRVCENIDPSYREICLSPVPASI